MSNPNDPAYPTMSRGGMTIRQEFVKAAMQGVLSDSDFDATATDIADFAVRCADAALAEEARTRSRT